MGREDAKKDCIENKNEAKSTSNILNNNIIIVLINTLLCVAVPMIYCIVLGPEYMPGGFSDVIYSLLGMLISGILGVCLNVILKMRTKISPAWIPLAVFIYPMAFKYITRMIMTIDFFKQFIKFQY